MMPAFATGLAALPRFNLPGFCPNPALPAPQLLGCSRALRLSGLPPVARRFIQILPHIPRTLPVFTGIYPARYSFYNTRASETAT
jgi:hypothetical protein